MPMRAPGRAGNGAGVAAIRPHRAAVNQPAPETREGLSDSHSVPFGFRVRSQIAVDDSTDVDAVEARIPGPQHDRRAGRDDHRDLHAGLARRAHGGAEPF
jgi:hypothetical protein